MFRSSAAGMVRHHRPLPCVQRSWVTSLYKEFGTCTNLLDIHHLRLRVTIIAFFFLALPGSGQRDSDGDEPIVPPGSALYESKCLYRAYLPSSPLERGSSRYP